MTLTAHQVSFEREEKPLIQNFSHTLHAGSVLLLRGKNGSGKTTLLKILAGMTPPTQGSVSWNGVTLSEERTQIARHFCYVGHKNALHPNLTARENLSFLAESYPLRSTLEYALQAVGMLSLSHLPLHTLSAGQKRRISLAKLVFLDTPLWFLDEPDAALDPEGIALVDCLIAEHIARQGSVVMTTHHDHTFSSHHYTHLLP